MLDNIKLFETEVAGRTMVVEVGKLAGLANGSCLIRYGETVILCAVTSSDKPREGIDFFPLSVNYEEKMYSVGKIPGSFQRREARPSDNAVLTSRVIDRPIRPLFPDGMRNDVSVVCTVMSVDPDCAPETLAMVGTSIALSISDIPWSGPISGVVVGLIDGEYIINPTRKQEKESEMQVTVASTADLVAMIEAGAHEVDNKTMFDGIMAGHVANQQIVKFINEIVAEVGKEKFEFESSVAEEDLYEAVKEFSLEKIKHALDTDDKRVRDERMFPIREEIYKYFAESHPDSEDKLDECIDRVQKYIVRRWLLDDGKRVDGRGIDDVRTLNSEVSLLPRVHGSGLFSRGQTQVLTVATLGTARDSQIIDGLGDEDRKRYMHHYNFPSYSVGETRPSRGPGRREIGHGALAERALLPVLPPIEDFPYTIRLVSEVVSSNGSTSQGAICGSTLALMDAGVPIKAPVAGISCGLITEDDRFMTMVDIQGLEDFYGDMDFKVGGTLKGITAIQMDLKIHGLTPEIIKEALDKTEKARIMILEDSMLKAISEYRDDVSKYAPKMLSTNIDVDKIRDVIGKGGAVIQKIQAECNCKIDIEDDGSVFITAMDRDDANRALAIVETIAKDPEVGAIYKGRVTRIMNFGAFVEIAPGKEGLVHISQLDVKRTNKVEDVVNVDDEILVKVSEIDEQGRLNLSRKDALIEVEGLEPEKPKPRQENKNFRSGSERGPRNN